MTDPTPARPDADRPRPRAGFRYAMTPRWRVVRTVGFTLAAVVLVALALGAPDLVGAVLALVVLAWCAMALRIVLGPAVVVTDRALVVIRSWPRRRRIPWTDIRSVEVVPDRWVLRLDRTDGTTTELPAVERLDELYELVERGRTGGYRANASPPARGNLWGRRR